ncbi:MAG: MotA/TolQ/ExbB proton channel family protein [Myxococcales bacterium]|nr:MotA/TolQ/ExbB proton channel family protein [Myxococcales bacterium]
MNGMTTQQVFEAVQAFIERGGDVLYLVFGVTALMWTMILERSWYMRVTHRFHVKAVLAQWKARKDHNSWYAEQIRRMLVAQVAERLHHSLNMIKTCVALCPLLGLLGTVTGMIEVFDVMAVAGNGNPRAMASGVSMATIPTMAGMVAALSGLYFTAQLKNYADNETRRVGDLMTS